VAGLEIADANTAVRVDTEDFVEGEYHCGSSRDNCAADDGHLPLINITAPDGETTVDHRRNAQHESEHHDHGEAVADAGLQVRGAEARTATRLREGGEGVEEEDRGDRKERSNPRASFDCELVCELHNVDGLLFLFSRRLSAALRENNYQQRTWRRCI
jgi:hypothetical protein